MKKESALTPEELAECAALKAIFRRSGVTQEEAGRMWDLGNQSNVGHYLNGRQPLNLKAAAKFAANLQVPIGDFSTRLAREARAMGRTAETVQNEAIAEIRRKGLDMGQPAKKVRNVSALEAASFTEGKKAVTVVAPEDLAPHTLRGFEVVIDSTRHSAGPGRLVVVLLASGECHLGIFRPVVGGFEVDIGRGVVLDAQRHGIEVLGVATETRQRFG